MKPRGYHLLFMELMAPLVQGQRVPVTLTFEKAGTRQVDLVVEAPGPVGTEILNVGQPG
jgi:copper(I)-binding protein